MVELAMDKLAVNLGVAAVLRSCSKQLRAWEGRMCGARRRFQSLFQGTSPQKSGAQEGFG